MSEGLIFRRGGSGGSGATLVVNSSGTGIVTVSNAELGKSYSKAVTMGGSVAFKGLATGTWTVTLSNDIQSTTQTVNITADYSIAAAFFDGTLYDAGDQYSDITGGWKVVNGGGGNSSIKTSYMLLSATSTAGDRASSIYTNNKINTSGYSTLCVEMNVTKKDTEYNQYGIWVGISNTNTDAEETNYVKYTKKNTTGEQTLSVDLSNHQGEYYIKLCAGVAAANVTAVYLE